MNENTKLSLRDTIAPKSDQLNYDDLASCSLSVRVTGLAAGSAEQPVIVRIARMDNNQPMRDFKPCKSMRRVLIAAWGDKGRDWVGKCMTLYGDSNVVFGGVAVGGIRISHVSGITEDMRVKLTTTRSKRTDYIVKPLVDAAQSDAGSHVPTRAECEQIIRAALPGKRAKDALAKCDLDESNWTTANDALIAQVAGYLTK